MTTLTIKSTAVKKKTLKSRVIEKWHTFYDWYTSSEKWTFKDYVAWYGGCALIGTFIGGTVRFIVSIVKISKRRK